MGVYTRPSIVTNGLVLNLDAANIKSYPGSGTTWTDLSGNSNTGTLTNGPTFSRDRGGSIVFNGSTQYTNIPNYSSSANYTLSCWTYYNTTGTDTGGLYRSFISKGSVFTSNSTFAFGLRRISANQARLFLWWYTTTSAGNEFLLPVDPYLQWNNYVATKNGTTYTLYVNGVILNTFVDTTTPPTNVYPLVIGGPYTTPANEAYYNGSISNTQIYNRALSASEVQQNYNALKSRFNLS